MLSQILIASRMKWPTDWSSIFSQKAPLIVEIGFGNGRFLADLAIRFPASNVLGIERSWHSIKKGFKHFRHCDLINTTLVFGDAFQVLWTLFEPATISDVYINFPDPWPKRRHWNRRLINRRFINLLASRMLAGGKLEIATDDLTYAEWISQRLAESSCFESESDDPYVEGLDNRLQTKYEHRAVKDQRLCAYFPWQRNAVPADFNFPLPKEYTMPLVEIDIPLRIDFLVSNLKLSQHQLGDISVRFVNAFLSRDGRLALVDMYVAEPLQDQRLMLAAREQDQGNYLLYVYETGYPRTTEGLHLAVLLLARAFEDLHPAANIVRHNLVKTIFN